MAGVLLVPIELEDGEVVMAVPAWASHILSLQQAKEYLERKGVLYQIHRYKNGAVGLAETAHPTVEYLYWPDPDKRTWPDPVRYLQFIGAIGHKIPEGYWRPKKKIKESAEERREKLTFRILAKMISG